MAHPTVRRHSPRRVARTSAHRSRAAGCSSPAQPCHRRSPSRALAASFASSAPPVGYDECTPGRVGMEMWERSGYSSRHDRDLDMHPRSSHEDARSRISPSRPAAEDVPKRDPCQPSPTRSCKAPRADRGACGMDPCGARETGPTKIVAKKVQLSPCSTSQLTPAAG